MKQNLQMEGLGFSLWILVSVWRPPASKAVEQRRIFIAGRQESSMKTKWNGLTKLIAHLGCFTWIFFILFTEFCPKFFSVQMILCSVRLRYKIWKRIFSLPEFCSIICRTGFNSGKGGGCQGENINEMLQPTFLKTHISCFEVQK